MAATKTLKGRTETPSAEVVKVGASTGPPEGQAAVTDEVPAGLRGTWIAPDVLIAFSIPVPETLAWPQLSRAEHETVELALQGLSTAAIGERRHVMARTVARQLDSAYRKLGVRSRGELAALAVSGTAGPKTRR